MADPNEIKDLLPRRPSALIAIGALGGFAAVLVVALLLMIATKAPDEIQFVAMDQPAEAPAPTAAQRDEPLDGFAIASANGCVACHSVDGAPAVGPTWLGSVGTDRDLEDGTTVPVDEAYLRRAILDPRAEVAAGFPDGVMPATYGDSLSTQQIDAILAYIVGLSG